ncbi:MAG: hypothetical protein K0S74_345 [Chlamydiales bacterium]|jgi:hypothetical protein|nr:hypothetical protein [Chlamydiales bacterium]
MNNNDIASSMINWQLTDNLATAQYGPSKNTSTSEENIFQSTHFEKFLNAQVIKDGEIECHSVVRYIETTYGSRLAEQISKAYFQDMEYIDISMSKLIFPAVAAKTTKADLKELHEDIRMNTNNFACKSALTEDQQWVLRYKEFNALTNTEISWLLQAFRPTIIENSTHAKADIDNGSNAKTELFGLRLFPNLEAPQVKSNVELYNDLATLRTFQSLHNYNMSELDKLNEKFRDLAPKEHMARQLAYAPPHIPSIDYTIEKGILPILDKTGQINYYEVHHRTHCDGLVCYICTPVTTGQWLAENVDRMPVKVLFRGTYCASSLQRDGAMLTQGEAGRKVFEKYFECIQQSLIDFLEQNKNGKVALDITGHSLGAIDAQRFVAMLAISLSNHYKKNSSDLEDPVLRNSIYAEEEEIKQNASLHKKKTLSKPFPMDTVNSKHESLEDNWEDVQVPNLKALEQIRSIQLVTWNSPCITRARAIQFNKARLELSERYGYDFLKITHNEVQNDLVHRAGTTLLGWEDKYIQKELKTRDLKFNPTSLFTFVLEGIRVSKGAYDAHTKACLTEEGRKAIVKHDEVVNNNALRTYNLLMPIEHVFTGAGAITDLASRSITSVKTPIASLYNLVRESFDSMPDSAAFKS